MSSPSSLLGHVAKAFENMELGLEKKTLKWFCENQTFQMQFQVANPKLFHLPFFLNSGDLSKNSSLALILGQIVSFKSKF